MSVYYNDIDPYCCKVLRKQIHLGNLPEGHVDERDIRTIRASELVGYRHIHLFAGIGGFPLGFKWAGFPDHISILTGGFPCQDISNAGKRAGIDGKRSGLWSEMYRLICELRPQYVCVENVAALLGRGIERVLGDLASCGYNAEWQVLPAAAFGAPHLRNRVFIVAYPYIFPQPIQRNEANAKSDQGYTWVEHFNSSGRQLGNQPGQDVAYTSSTRLERSRKQRGISSAPQQWTPAIFERGDSTRPQWSTWWAVEPNVGRVVTRLPAWLDGGINAHENCIKKARTKGIPLTSEVRELWQHRKHTETPSRSSKCLICGIPLSELPCEGRYGPWYVGAWQEETKGVRHMREGLYSVYAHQKQDMQPGMSLGTWAPQCEQTLENRTDRLKGLGNAVVPQIPEYIARCIMAHAAEMERVA